MTAAASTPPPVLDVEVRWRPQSPNASIRQMHWAVRARRHRAAHHAFAVAVRGRPVPPLPVIVELVRVSVSSLDAFENLPQSLKPLTDAVASWLEARSDRDPRITWRASQEHTGEREMIRDGQGVRRAFRCFAIVRIWPDPSNTSPAPKPPRPRARKPAPALVRPPPRLVAVPRPAPPPLPPPPPPPPLEWLEPGTRVRVVESGHLARAPYEGTVVGNNGTEYRIGDARSYWLVARRFVTPVKR